MRHGVLFVLAACAYHAPVSPAGPDIDAAVDASGDADPDGPPVPWLHPWSHRKAITIHGNLVAGTLADFPVLIAADDAQIAAAAHAGGTDIRFTTADATTLLDSEVESLQGNKLTAWVKLPVLEAGTDVHLFIYYGNPNNPGATDPTDVWTANYRGVWHFSEDPSAGGGNNIKDSTDNNLDGTATQMAAGNRVPMKAGNGYQFDGSTKFVDFPSTNVGNTFSISMWVSMPTATGIKTLYANSAQGATTDGIRFFINTNGNSDRKVTLETGNGMGSVAACQTGNDAIPADTPKHVAATIDRGVGTAKLYIDGALVVSGSARTDFIIGSDFEVGRMEGSLFYTGQIDEFEIAEIERPLEWWTTTFRNQNNPGAFATADGEEDEP